MRTLNLLLVAILFAGCNKAGLVTQVAALGVDAEGLDAPEWCCVEGQLGPVVLGEVTITQTGRSVRPADVTFVTVKPSRGLRVTPKGDVAPAPAEGGPPPADTYVLPRDSSITFEVVLSLCPSIDAPAPQVVFCIIEDLDNDGSLDIGVDLPIGELVGKVTVKPAPVGGPPPPPRPAVSVGVYPTGPLLSPDGISLGIQLDSLWLGGSNGGAEYDFQGDIVDQGGFRLFDNPAGNFGVRELEANGTRALFLYGSSDGVIRPWSNGAWGNFVQLLFRQGVSDANYLTSRPRGEALIVAWGGVSTLHHDGLDWVRKDIYLGAATGPIISAAARDLDSRRLFVVDGNPGAIWQHVGGIADRPVKVGDTGASPRIIRCLENLAVVPNFDSGSLTVLRWETDGTTEMKPPLPAGDGPVGPDLKIVPQGYAIITTGSRDNTYTINILNTALEVIKTVTKPVPISVTGPAHAAWISDSDHIIISGTGSNNFAIVDVSADLAP